MKSKLILVFVFFSFLSYGQLNESDTLVFKGDLSLTGFYQDGNVETFIFRAKSNISLRAYKKWVFKTTNSYVYQEFGKKKADEDILSLNFLYFNPNRKFYPLILGFVSTNFRREINLRTLWGGGITYKVLDEKKYKIKVSLSSEYEQTEFRKNTFNISEYNENNYINTMRGTFWINGKYELFNKKMILNHELYFQPSLEKSNNFRYQADFGIELPLWKFLNFKVNYLHTYESIVIENQKQEDKMLTLGFTLKSY